MPREDGPKHIDFSELVDEYEHFCPAWDYTVEEDHYHESYRCTCTLTHSVGRQKGTNERERKT